MSAHTKPILSPHTAESVLLRTADELRTLAQKTTHIQEIVGTLMSNAACIGEDISDLQELDHITQSIDGLSDFLRALASDTPTTWNYPELLALKTLKLEGLAARLSNTAKETPTSTLDDDGDLDLF